MTNIPGLGDRRSSNRMFLSVVNGEFAQRFDKHVEENGERVTEERELVDKNGNPTGQKVIERYFGSITGLITEAKVEKVDFDGGKKAFFMKFVFQNGDFQFQLSIPTKSGYANSLLKRISATNPDNEIKFEPYAFDDKEKNKRITGINVYENNVKIDPIWTKENPGDCPPAIQITNEVGELEWDFTAQKKFMFDKFKIWAEKCKTLNPEASAPAQPTHPAAQPAPAQVPQAPSGAAPVQSMKPEIDDSILEEDDDLPF